MSTKCVFLRIHRRRMCENYFLIFLRPIQYCIDLRKPDLRKNLNLRKIVAKTDFLVHKLFDLRKIFQGIMFDLRKNFFQIC